MGALTTLNIQLLGAAHPLAAEWLRWTAWHPELRTVRLVSAAHAGASAEELHPGLFGFRGLGISTEAGAADVTVICPEWTGDLPPEGGQVLDLRPRAAGHPTLPELHPPAALASLASVPARVVAAALALEPLLRGRVVSPRESIGLTLDADDLEALRPLLTGHFRLETLPGDGGTVQARIPLFEGYSEHDALAVYRDEYRSQPWIRIRRAAEQALGVTGSPTCELHLRILEREDPEIPIPLLGVTAGLDPFPAQAARAVAALNLSRGWPALLGLIPAETPAAEISS
ncbi:hypothetical protein GCM10017783_09950 [Deinococcus piscis]|uniref:Uncharacterized protein n=1 Tax=Deinococcus piscis TaxID=394230 RepID=A0ABQ3K254_9DEIO|nr:hypothetical protein [Deinococcus piscis]GHF99915.1 hypothetical protein GCM10017783_09950 [Deinococcus piscis]